MPAKDSCLSAAGRVAAAALALLLATRLVEAQQTASSAQGDPDPQVEWLLPFLLDSQSYPTAYDQLLVELTNRARANPAAEAARYAIDLNEGLAPGTITTTPKQPLAVNLSLVYSAQQHSQWMIDTDTFSHTGSGGTNPGQRMTAAGYVFNPPWTWGENIALYMQRPTVPDTAWATAYLHELLFVDEDYAGRGHRLNIMNDAFRELGAGVKTGLWVSSGYTWNAVDCTEDFASTAGNGFITGVAYTDQVVADGFYTVGEGLSGVTVTATRQSDQLQLATATWSSGGYTIQAPDGTYTVQASGGGLPGTVVCAAVVAAGRNVKVDFTPAMVPLGVSAALDWNWTYQNAPTTTQGRQQCVLTISVTSDPHGNSSYSAAVTRNPSSTGQVVITSTAAPLVWHIKGGQHGADPIGSVTLDITVTGNQHGGTGATTAGLSVRLLGDVDADGGLDGDGKAQMNRRLNSLSVSYPDRAFNLTGNLDGLGNPSIDGDDKAVMNRLLNSLVIP